MLRGFLMAWGCFSTIPCPSRKWEEEKRDWMLLMLPFLGALLGLLWYGLYAAFLFFKIPVPLAAAILTIYPFFITGGIHLDGYMDCCDGIFSRRPLEERQRILKDSTVGAFSVVWTIFIFLLFFGAMWSILMNNSFNQGIGLIFIMIVTRMEAAHGIMTKKPMGTSQYYDISKRKAEKRTYSMKLIWVVIFLLVLLVIPMGHGKWLFLIPPFVAMFGDILAIKYGRKQLGGMNGDIAGFGIVIGELVGVISLVFI